jgi:hypothetical protein
MEEIMREELTQFLGAEWGECCAERKGYRNGSYTRDLATRVRVPSRIFRFLEIEKATSIPRSLIATVAMSLKWQRD